MSSLKHVAPVGSLLIGALFAAGCQTQAVTAIPDSSLGGAADQNAPKVEIMLPHSLALMSSGTPFLIEWTYSNLGSPQWKLYLNTGSTGYVEQPTAPQCAQGICSQSMTLYPGIYELIIKELTTGIDDKVAFTVQ